METVLGIFTSLGANSTIVIQLGIFLVVFLFVLQVGAKPYFKAFEERQRRTQGNEKQAEQLVAQSRELEAMFQRKARGLNLDIKSIYDKERTEAQREQERILVEAKEKAKGILDKARSVILEQYNKAREELFKEAPTVGRSIAERLINKGPQ